MECTHTEQDTATKYSSKPVYTETHTLLHPSYAHGHSAIDSVVSPQECSSGS